MDKLKSTTLSIIIFFVVIIFSGCVTMHDISFYHGNETLYKPSVSIWNDGPRDYWMYIKLYDSYPKEYFEIEKFEFDNGFIQINDYKIVIDKGINIDIRIDDYNWDKTVYYISNGRIGYSNVARLNAFKNSTDNSIIEYRISFMQESSKKDVKKILDEYKRNNNSALLYIKYEITINNEIINREVFEEVNFEIETMKIGIKEILFGIFIFIITLGKGFG